MSKAKLDINVMRVAGPWSKSLPGYKAKAEGWAKAALGKSGGEVSIVFAGDAFVRELNHTYRGKDKPTNVLSFPGAHSELGDVVLAYETIYAEAKAQKKSFARHTAHLIVHGCLHLLGYDHEQDKDAVKMEALETRILATLGFPSPYEMAA